MKKMSRETIILLILGVFFWLVYSYGVAFTSFRANSPDEAANYFWINQYQETSQLKMVEPQNSQLGNVIHPRSVNVDPAGNLVPGSFLGLIFIFGNLAKVFGFWSWLFVFVLFLPLLSVFSVWAFYGLVRIIFDKKIALISSVLFFLHPAFWYYTVRGLLPNVLFLDLLILGTWVVTRRFAVRPPRLGEAGSSRFAIYLNYILGGLLIGLALTVRTSEVIWVGLVILGLVIFYRRKINWPALVLFFISIAITFVPVLLWNKVLYGGYLSSGYFNLEVSQFAVSGSQFAGQSLSATRLAEALAKRVGYRLSAILPFGLHPRAAFWNFWHYDVLMLWWYFVPLMVGLGWFLINAVCRSQFAVRQKINSDSEQRTANSEQRNRWVYLSVFAFVSAWLLLYYGSWQVKDNISGHYTIGTSYLRYWLPALVLSLPLVSWLIVKILDWFKEKLSKVLVGILILGLFLVLSVNLTFNSEEGLNQLGAEVYKYKIINQIARQELDKNSIIISDRSDKVFWPEFRVAVFLGDFTVFQNLGKVADRAPVYYYSHNQLTEANLRYLNDNIGKWGLVLTPERSLDGEDELYKLMKK